MVSFLGFWKFNAESEEVHFVHVSKGHSDNDDDTNGFDLPRYGYD